MVHPDKHPDKKSAYEEIAKEIGMALDILNCTDESEDTLDARKKFVRAEKAAWKRYQVLFC